MTAGEPGPAPGEWSSPADPGPDPVLSAAGLLALLVLDAVLVAVFGLAFTPFYVGAVPVPVGALATIVLVPWLVGRAGELDPRFAAVPLIAWALTIGLFGLGGPGGDVLLPVTWPTLLLLFGGLGAGLWRLRGTPERRGEPGG